ncbi:MAG TPA: acetyl-CoA carboxylase, carboxyltransferase subunit beta [Armatimonadota bacterium]|jgi:acetyl-CoA carboxylase carboxyl transferase subunit beta
MQNIPESGPENGAGNTIKPPASGVPAGLWEKCPKCRAMLYVKELERSFRVCHNCQYHFPLGTGERIALLTDPESFTEIDASMRPCNPLDFPDYNEKLIRGQEKTGQKEGYVYGDAAIGGVPVVLGVASFAFMGGSMGSVVGEKVARALERGAELSRPVVLVCASGGARMHEGIISLMQMAKTAAASERLKAAGQLYIIIMTDPTTAGVLASYASLGDILIAEPAALVGFAGPRVIEQNLKVKLPPGTHTAEFQLNHGMIDMVVHRRDLKTTVAKLLNLLAPVPEQAEEPEALTEAVAS